MATEYARFDSADKYRQAAVRLTKDSESRDGEHGKMVRLTFTSECRSDKFDTLWIECNVGDFHADAASFLLKGDVIPLVEGKPGLRRYGDDNEKWSFCLNRAELVFGGELFKTLKERGYEPGAKATAKPAAKTGKPVGKPAAKAVKPAAKKPVLIEISDDPDDDDCEVDEDDE